MLRPDQQRPRRRAARTLLLLLVAVVLVLLGSRTVLEQSSARLNGHAASQAQPYGSGSSEGGSSSSSSAALQQQVDELLRDKAALEAQLAELRQQVERSAASTGSAQVQSAAVHLCAVCIVCLRCPGISASAGLQHLTTASTTNVVPPLLCPPLAAGLCLSSRHRRRWRARAGQPLPA